MRQREGVLRSAPHIVEFVARLRREPGGGGMLALGHRDKPPRRKGLPHDLELLLRHLRVACRPKKVTAYRTVVEFQ